MLPSSPPFLLFRVISFSGTVVRRFVVILYRSLPSRLFVCLLCNLLLLTPLSSPPITQPSSLHSSFHVVTTSAVQYTSPPAVSLFLHQYMLPGARESTYSHLSRLWYAHITFTPPVLPSRSYYRRTFPRWLIIQPFPSSFLIFWFLLSFLPDSSRFINRLTFSDVPSLFCLSSPLIRQ